MKLFPRKPTGILRAGLMLGVALCLGFVFGLEDTMAAIPGGNNWFEIRVNPFTGKDDTGDGGTGNFADLNYFYVGQRVDANLIINTTGAAAANLWIDFDPLLVQVSNLLGGNFFGYWVDQTIISGRAKSTGFNNPYRLASGQGSFGTMKLTMLKPSAANYGTSTPAILNINTGAIGATTESNIADGTSGDKLSGEEDFKFHIWADTKAPFVSASVPAAGATNVPVNMAFSFVLRDTRGGEGDLTGVGTGVNTTPAAADILINNGSTTVSYKTLTSFTCSGIWGSDMCEAQVFKPLLTTFAGDTRNWKYGTTYTITISGFQDYASSNQNQLGDRNGPNVMAPKTLTFRTVDDTNAPLVQNLLPANGSIGLPLNTVISFEISDRAVYPSGMSGSGVDPTTCRINVASPSFGSYEYKSTDSAVLFLPRDYGYFVSVDPAMDFASNETVTVRLSGCADKFGNKAVTETLTFKTVILDGDNDGVLDSVDNCPTVVNPTQADMDKDGKGDACDTDRDGDGVLNTNDNCPDSINAQQGDMDKDGIGDVCDADRDGDGIPNTTDNCPNVPNPAQADMDKDGEGDRCDDIDKDSILDHLDNCPLLTNPSQSDSDKDAIGDACDNCPGIQNGSQSDRDKDGFGDECDNCPDVENPDQADADKDGIGNYCDKDFLRVGGDNDGDLVLNENDNCPFTPNPEQKDTDADLIGNLCDNCPFTKNPLQTDTDGDGIGDLCDVAKVVESPTATTSTLEVNLFRDTNLNGIRDTGETAAWTGQPKVELYYDTNANKKADPPADILAKSLVSTTGSLTFTNLQDGAYALRITDFSSGQFSAPTNVYGVSFPPRGSLAVDIAIHDEILYPSWWFTNTELVNTLVAEPWRALASFTPPALVSFKMNYDLNTEQYEQATVSYYRLVTPGERPVKYTLVVGFDPVGTYKDSQDLQTLEGGYQGFVKGEGHLSKSIGITSLTKSTTSVDFAFKKDEVFFAGDLNDDDVINAPDIARVIQQYQTTGDKIEDLNNDGIVNTFDLARLIVNYNRKGDMILYLNP